jgi:hypothetical protein
VDQVVAGSHPDRYRSPSEPALHEPPILHGGPSSPYLTPSRRSGWGADRSGSCDGAGTRRAAARGHGGERRHDGDNLRWGGGPYATSWPPAAPRPLWLRGGAGRGWGEARRGRPQTVAVLVLRTVPVLIERERVHGLHELSRRSEVKRLVGDAVRQVQELPAMVPVELRGDGPRAFPGHAGGQRPDQRDGCESADIVDRTRPRHGEA